MAYNFNQQYSIYYQKVRMMYQKPELKASLEIILSVFAVGLLILFAIRPTVTNISKLQKKIVDQGVVLKKIDLKISQVTKAQQQLTQFSDKLYLYNNAVPDGYNYADIAMRIEAVAVLSGVKLSDVQYPGILPSGLGKISGLDAAKLTKMQTPDANGLLSMPVSIVIDGGQNEVFSFLNNIENMDRLAMIKDVTISKSGGNSKDSVRSLKVNLTAIFYSIAKNK